MPELPEVTYQKKYADATVLHKEIVRIEFGAKKIFQSAEKEFKEALMHQQFSESERLGKYLFLKTESEKCLVLHFGMTGRLDYYQHNETPKHAQLTLHFKDNSCLSYICPRKFGKLFLANSVAAFQKEHEIGPDALQLNQQEFLELLQGKKGSIKGALMNQKLIAGLGNLYSDEVLFQCNIHPKSKVSALSEEEKKCIFKTMGEVLKVVTDARSSGEKLPQNYLTPNREDGSDCPRAKGEIEMIKVSGRSTYFCPECQREKS